MPFISGGDRRQVMFAALDDMVAPDSEARVIDAFVGSLDLDAMGFARVELCFVKRFFIFSSPPSFDCHHVNLSGFVKGMHGRLIRPWMRRPIASA